MTETLKTLMDERASRPDFPVPDLATVRSAGLRQRRRRRYAVTSATAGLAACAVVATVLATGSGGPAASPDVADDPTTPAAPPVQVSYAVGSVIHLGEESIEVGHRVESYVRTGTGFVFVDDRSRVWSVVGGRVLPVGQAEQVDRALVSDPGSGLAAWVDLTTGRPRVAVLDQSSGSEPTYLTGPPDRVYAIDGRTVYVEEGGNAVAVNLSDGLRTLIDSRASQFDDVIDARAGVVAFVVDDPGLDARQHVAVGPTRAETGEPFPAAGSKGILSPDGRYLSFEADTTSVYDTSDGGRLELGPAGFSSAFEWWDATTVALISAPQEDGPVQILACDVRTAVCDVVAPDLGTIDDLQGDLVLPGGLDVAE